MAGAVRWVDSGFNPVAYTKPFSSFAMNGITEIVPEHLLRGNKWAEFAKWLMKGVPDEKHRKYIALEWCKVTGLEFTRSLALELKIEQYP